MICHIKRTGSCKTKCVPTIFTDQYAILMAEMVEMQKMLEKMNADLRKASGKL
jgi:hypothetical protein